MSGVVGYALAAMLALSAAVLIATFVLPWIALARRTKRCPTCRARAIVIVGAVLATRRDGNGQWRPAHETSYRCRACGGEFRALNAGPLIARAAWDDGAREDIPRAIARPRE